MSDREMFAEAIATDVDLSPTFTDAQVEAAAKAIYNVRYASRPPFSVGAAMANCRAYARAALSAITNGDQ